MMDWATFRAINIGYNSATGNEATVTFKQIICCSLVSDSLKLLSVLKVDSCLLSKDLLKPYYFLLYPNCCKS